MEDVKQDIDTLYSKVNDVSDRLTKVEASIPLMVDLVKENTESNKKLGETLTEVRLSMVKMNEKMDAQAKEAVDMRNNLQDAITDTNKKVESIDKKIEKVENKGKFDIWDFINSKFPWIIIAIGACTYLASKFVSF